MKKLIVTVICVLALFLFVGCSSAASHDSASTTEMTAPQSASKVYEEYAAEPAATESYDEAAAAEEAGSGDLGGLPDVNIPDTGRKLIYSSSMEIETKQFDEDYTKVKAALSASNGYVENENTYASGNEYGSSRYSSLTLRVPMNRYSAFLDTLSGVGEVVDKQITTEDISSQYFDTDARIEILEQRRTRLMGYLETATKMDDIVTLERELSDVLYELDQYKGSKRGMDDLVDYASVTVNLREVITAETISPNGDPVGVRAANAYQMSMTSVGKFLQDFAVGFAAAAPVLILLAIIGAIVFAVIKLVRFLQRRWREKRVAKAGNTVPPPSAPPAGISEKK